MCDVFALLSILLLLLYSYSSTPLFSIVSHTTDDLVFVWELKTPLVVDDRIELPQLDLVNTVTGDCTQVYSTGIADFCFPNTFLPPLSHFLLDMGTTQGISLAWR